jgi:hypothetical protein
VGKLRRLVWTHPDVPDNRVVQIVLKYLGGAFPEGKALIGKLRTLASYFAVTQRATRLAKIKNKFRLPAAAAHVDAETRIGFVSALLAASLLNEYAYNMYRQRFIPTRTHFTDAHKFY